MSLTYATYLTSLANLLTVPENDAGFLTVLPNIIDDAELRMYRDLDLIETVNIPIGHLGTSSMYQTIPFSPVVVKGITVLTPLGANSDTATGRFPLTPSSLETIYSLWPASGSTIPQYFAMVDQALFIVGPRPDAAYNFEAVVTVRYASLSASNSTTLFSTSWPDLLIAASMVFGAAYQRNFGAGVDDPKMATTWESHYQTLLAGAMKEEDRKRQTERAIPITIPPIPTPRV